MTVKPVRRKRFRRHLLQPPGVGCFVLQAPQFMKNAYELAMERLAKSDPSSGPLTAGQKTKLAEIDLLYKGKLAEREIFLKKQIDDALSAQKFEEIEKIRQQMGSERARLDEEREADKEKLRQSFGAAKP